MLDPDIPREIIIEIIKSATHINPTGDRIGSKELRQLRLVSKFLNNVASPLLFSTLHLQYKPGWNNNFATPDNTRCQEIITALVTRSTTVFDYTKKLYLSTEQLYWSDMEGAPSARAFLLDNIFGAIRALKTLRTVDWSINSDFEPEELSIEVVQVLGTLPLFQGFEDLRFRFTPPPSFTLEPLSNLTILRTEWHVGRPERLSFEIASLLSRCPEMKELCFKCQQSSIDRAVSLREPFSQLGQLKEPWGLQKLELRDVEVAPEDIESHIQHFQNLTFLGITGNPSREAATTFGGICDILRKQTDIKLRSVVIDIPEDPLFLSYLSSYSGLTSLSLQVPTETYGNTQVINQIYMQILPKHADTLECLEMRWIRAPTQDQLVQVIKCQKLTRLQVYIDTMNEGVMRGSLSTHERWFQAGRQLPKLTQLHFLLTPTQLSGDLPRLFTNLEEIRAKYRREKKMKFKVIID